MHHTAIALALFFSTCSSGHAQPWFPGIGGQSDDQRLESKLQNLQGQLRKSEAALSQAGANSSKLQAQLHESEIARKQVEEARDRADTENDKLRALLRASENATKQAETNLHALESSRSQSEQAFSADHRLGQGHSVPSAADSSNQTGQSASGDGPSQNARAWAGWLPTSWAGWLPDVFISADKSESGSPKKVSAHGKYLSLTIIGAYAMENPLLGVCGLISLLMGMTFVASSLVAPLVISLRPHREIREPLLLG